MQLSAIDLNLLTALDALLVEQNVTRASKRLGLSQPAVSHALRRLRDLLGDPLLIRDGAGMVPTPRALALRGPVRAALDAAEIVLRAAPAFDPATASRTFRVSMADQQAFVLMPRLVPRLAREAPGIRIDVQPLATELAADVELAIGVYVDTPSNVREQPLWRETFTCMLRKGSPGARGPLDRKRYLALSHLVVAPRGTPGSYVDDSLAQSGERRNVALRVPHFLVAPHVIAASDLVWTAPTSIAETFAKLLPVVLREPPLRLDGFTIAMRWHVRVDHDPALAWLRRVIAELA